MIAVVKLKFQTTLTGYVSIYKVFHKFFVSVASSPSFGLLLSKTPADKIKQKQDNESGGSKWKAGGEGGGGGSLPPLRP